MGQVVGVAIRLDDDLAERVILDVRNLFCNTPSTIGRHLESSVQYSYGVSLFLELDTRQAGMYRMFERAQGCRDGGACAPELPHAEMSQAVSLCSQVRIWCMIV